MKATLTLEDGFSLTGTSVNGPVETGGEVIFTTAMTGYQEVLTDPSYKEQLVCMTWPLIGNYGINREDMESSAIHAGALLVKECCKEPSNWRSELSLPKFLEMFDVPCVENLDTRALARHIRMHGAMRGLITTQNHSPEELRQRIDAIPSMSGHNLTPKVSAKHPYIWKDGKPLRVELQSDKPYAWTGSGLPLAVYDFGIKWNILRHLAAAGFETLCLPPTTSPEEVLASGAKALFLSNGPGDPGAMDEETAQIRELCEKIPVVGICLGHQLIGRALGATTEKLKFGHHGCNHPVKDLKTGKIEISSQNHGFHVILENAPDLEATHINLNDGTLEGLRHKHKPIMSLQYHPEAAAGPRDANHLFHKFRDMIEAAM